jgi:hypothetical protein
MSDTSCQQKESAKLPKTGGKIHFINQDGDEIGVLDFTSSCLAFEGNAEQSAIAFMQQVGNQYQHRLRQEYSKGYRAGKASK